MNSTTVYLPFSSSVNVHAFCNASLQQRVTIKPENAQPIVYTGSGEHDRPLGQTFINTPASGSSPRGFQVTVNVDTWQGGQWKPSAVGQGGCQIMYYNAILVISEDLVDQDWNDGVVLFTWWVPPSQRSIATDLDVMRATITPPDVGQPGPGRPGGGGSIS